MTRLLAPILIAGSVALFGSALVGALTPSRGPRHRFDWWGVTLAWSDGE